jgi:hypothetical protein
VNNPLKYIDPNGKEIVGTDGKPVTYSRDEETGKVNFTSNASNATIKIGNALLKTETGTKQLDKSDVKTELIVSPETKIGNNGLPRRGGTRLASEKQADETYKAKSAKITIYEGSVNKTASDKGYEREQVFGATAGHEIDHVTNPENVDKSQKNIKEGAKFDVESGPDVIRNQIIKEYSEKCNKE